MSQPGDRAKVFFVIRTSAESPVTNHATAAQPDAKYLVKCCRCKTEQLFADYRCEPAMTCPRCQASNPRPACAMLIQRLVR